MQRQEFDNFRRALRILAGNLEEPDVEAKHIFQGNGKATTMPPGPGPDSPGGET